MKSLITVLTIGVDDLGAAVRFYRDGLGLSTEGIVGTEFEYGAVAFFDLDGGIRLALWPRQSISYDTGIPETPHGPTEFTIGHNVGSREAVDAVMAQAAEAGANIVKPAANTFWGGYAGYFQDPDDHLWEVVSNPAIHSVPSGPPHVGRTAFVPQEGAGELATASQDQYSKSAPRRSAREIDTAVVGLTSPGPH